MTSTPTPSDYDAEDSWDDDAGREQCAHCHAQLGPPLHDEVYDYSGRHYEYFLDTDPMDAPFFCPDCWTELRADVRSQENQSLAAFTRGDQP